jgi:ABC-type Fe3+-hydroxamate transport system substrate-binding protein
MKSTLLLLISVLALSGCSLFQPEIVVQTQLSYTKVTCPDYPKPAGTHMLPVEPRAITDADGMAWVGLTPQHYANLGLNTQDTIRYIKSQKGQTRYYRDCIIDFNAEIERLQNLETNND